MSGPTPIRLLILGSFAVHLGVNWVAAAPGDEVARLSPTRCTSAPADLAFDGRILYFTQYAPNDDGKVFRVEARTGLDLGFLQLERGGSPYLERIGGLALDTNRGRLWVGATGDDLLSVVLDSGEIVTMFHLSGGGSAGHETYDYILDEIWETDGTQGGLQCWMPDGRPCGGLAQNPDAGIAFDGVDIWHFTTQPFSPPGPADEGVLYPTIGRSPIADFTRAHVLPTRDYNGLAYDCETFTVPVVWTGDLWACQLVAYEVSSRSSCSRADSPRILMAATARLGRLAKLPITTANADRFARKMSPFQQQDPNALREDWGELIFYTVLGPGDVPEPTVLKLLADRASNSVVLTE